MTQPEALRLADVMDECKYVDVYRCKQAAAELRRLHAENTAAVSSFLSADDERTKLRAQRDALLEVLRPFAAMNASIGHTYRDVERARAAIAAAEQGEKE